MTQLSPIKQTAIVTLTSLLFACGGGGSSISQPSVTNVTPTPTAPTTYTGVFVDSPVSGLRYKTASQEGTTNTNGEFIYQANEMITFSIGGIEFPAISPKSTITPLDIFSTEDLSNTAVINMLRLLQTLDMDGIASNGITIADAAHELAANLTVNFSSPTFDNTVADFVLQNNAINTYLISEEQALMHFRQTLNIEQPTTSNCGTNHPKVGYSGNFQTYFHNVSGTATFTDNCTITITEFSYDGGGPEVYFYGAIDQKFGDSSAFAIGQKINGRVYNNETITLRLPNNKSLDDLSSLSVWCVDFSANFGDVVFTP